MIILSKINGYYLNFIFQICIYKSYEYNNILNFYLSYYVIRVLKYLYIYVNMNDDCTPSSSSVFISIIFFK